MQKLWNVKVTSVPVVFDALGTVSEELEEHLKSIVIPIVISFFTESCNGRDRFHT